jgi:hypothetical protein
MARRPGPSRVAPGHRLKRAPNHRFHSRVVPGGDPVREELAGSTTEVSMTKTLIAVIALVIGLAIGAFGALTFGGGMMAGAGAAAGLSVGICSTVRAAQEEGLMTAEQVDRVLNRAAQDLSGAGELPPGHEVVGSAAACEKVLARVRESQSK